MNYATRTSGSCITIGIDGYREHGVFLYPERVQIQFIRQIPERSAIWLEQFYRRDQGELNK